MANATKTLPAPAENTDTVTTRFKKRRTETNNVYSIPHNGSSHSPHYDVRR